MVCRATLLNLEEDTLKDSIAMTKIVGGTTTHIFNRLELRWFLNTELERSRANLNTSNDVKRTFKSFCGDNIDALIAYSLCVGSWPE